MLILPTHPDFKNILNTLPPPPGWGGDKQADHEIAFVSDSETGLLRPATRTELFDYAYGGEYAEYLEKFGDDEDLEEYGDC